MIRGLGSVETIRFDSRIRFSGLSKCCLNFAYEDLFHTVSFRIEALSLTVRLESLASQLHGEGECFAPPLYLFLKKEKLPQVLRLRISLSLWLCLCLVLDVWLAACLQLEPEPERRTKREPEPASASEPEPELESLGLSSKLVGLQKLCEAFIRV